MLMLTLKQVAEELGSSQVQALSLVQRGQIDAVNIAADPTKRAAWRVSREALNNFKTARSNRPRTKPRRNRPETAITEYV